MASRRSRTIEKLRHLYPGQWSYDRDEGTWKHEDGWIVRAYAHLDGIQEDSYTTMYHREDTGECVLWGRRHHG
jgi:hypothetical protein